MKIRPRHQLLALLLISALGFTLRVYHLESPSLWCDEFASVEIVKLPWPQFLEEIRAGFYPSGYHPIQFPGAPLYYLLLRPFIRVAGLNEWTLRFPSLIFSVATIFALFLLVRDLYGWREGLTAAFLLAISPFAIKHAQDARMYSLFWLLSTLTFWSYRRFLTSADNLSPVLYIFFSVACIFSLPIGFLFVIVQNLLFFLIYFQRRTVKKWLWAQGIIFLLSAPSLAAAFVNLFSRSWAGRIAAVPNYPQLLYGIFLSNAGIDIGAQRVWETWAFLLLLAVAFLKRGKTGLTFDLSHSNLLLAGWTIIPPALMIAVNLLGCNVLSGGSIRYAGYIHLALIAFLSKAVNSFRFPLKTVLILSLAAVIGINHLYPYHHYNLKTPLENWRELYRQLSKVAGQDDLIVLRYICTSQHRFYGQSIPSRSREWWGKAQINKIVSSGDYDSVFIVYRGKREGEECSLITLKDYYPGREVKLGYIGFWQYRKRE